jgi:hypothetical protein
VTGVHGLQHVNRFTRTDFTYNNAIGSHAQRIANEVPNGSFSGTFSICWSTFESQNMATREPKFGGVFDRDHPFIRRNERSDRIEQRGFPCSRASAHDDVAP